MVAFQESNRGNIDYYAILMLPSFKKIPTLQQMAVCFVGILVVFTNKFTVYLFGVSLE